MMVSVLNYYKTWFVKEASLPFIGSISWCFYVFCCRCRLCWLCSLVIDTLLLHQLLGNGSSGESLLVMLMYLSIRCAGQTINIPVTGRLPFLRRKDCERQSIHVQKKELEEGLRQMASSSLGCSIGDAPVSHCALASLRIRDTL